MVDAAVLEKLEAGFKKLQAATDCKSLLKKYLTREVFDQLKGKKTSLGATLLDVIQSGKLIVLDYWESLLGFLSALNLIVKL